MFSLKYQKIVVAKENLLGRQGKYIQEHIVHHIQNCFAAIHTMNHMHLHIPWTLFQLGIQSHQLK